MKNWMIEPIKGKHIGEFNGNLLGLLNWIQKSQGYYEGKIRHNKRKTCKRFRNPSEKTAKRHCLIWSVCDGASRQKLDKIGHL